MPIASVSAMVIFPAREIPDTVYLVDKGRQFADMASQLLRQQGLTVFDFDSPTRLLHRFNPVVPACLLCEWQAEGFDGLQLTQQLQALHHRPPSTVFVGQPGDVAGAVAAMRSGAVDFLDRPLRPVALLESVRTALELDHRDRERHADRALLDERYARLTPRETQVFAVLLENHSAKQIALQLQISPRTAEHHREGVMRKMKARSWQQLLVMGILLGLYEPRLSHDERAGPVAANEATGTDWLPASAAG